MQVSAASQAVICLFTAALGRNYLPLNCRTDLYPTPLHVDVFYSHPPQHQWLLGSLSLISCFKDNGQHTLLSPQAWMLVPTSSHRITLCKALLSVRITDILSWKSFITSCHMLQHPYHTVTARKPCPQTHSSLQNSQAPGVQGHPNLYGNYN